MFFLEGLTFCRSPLDLQNDSTEAKLAMNAEEGGALDAGATTRPHSPPCILEACHKETGFLLKMEG